jgi:hypothetical protein
MGSDQHPELLVVRCAVTLGTTGIFATLDRAAPLAGGGAASPSPSGLGRHAAGRSASPASWAAAHGWSRSKEACNGRKSFGEASQHSEIRRPILQPGHDVLQRTKLRFDFTSNHSPKSLFYRHVVSAPYGEMAIFYPLPEILSNKIENNA